MQEVADPAVVFEVGLGGETGGATMLSARVCGEGLPESAGREVTAGWCPGPSTATARP